MTSEVANHPDIEAPLRIADDLPEPVDIASLHASQQTVLKLHAAIQRAVVHQSELTCKRKDIKAEIDCQIDDEGIPEKLASIEYVMAEWKLAALKKAVVAFQSRMDDLLLDSYNPQGGLFDGIDDPVVCAVTGYDIEIGDLSKIHGEVAKAARDETYSGDDNGEE